MKFLLITFILALTFPYIQIIPSDGYTQPLYLILGSILAYRFRHIGFDILPSSVRATLFFLSIAGVSLFLISCFPYSSAQEYKYLISYVSPLLLVFTIIVMLESNLKLVRTVLEAAILTWALVSFIQLTFLPSFMIWSLGSWAETVSEVGLSGRGVVGLAPEPTHHAFHMLLMGAALSLLGGRRWIVLVCIVEALVFARSSSAVLALSLGFLLLSFRRPGVVFPVLFVAAASFGVVELWISTFGDDVRLFVLLKSFLDDPFDIILSDFSVNMRLGGAYASFVYAFENFLVPEGLSHSKWLITNQQFLLRHPWLFDISTVGPPSGIGILFFQAGALVLPFVFIWLRSVLKAPVDSLLGAWLVCTSVVIFFGQLYIAAPLFSFVYGCAIFAARRKSSLILDSNQSVLRLVS